MTGENAPQAAQETPGALPAPTPDVSAIHRAAAEGLPVMPGQILALLDYIEALSLWRCRCGWSGAMPDAQPAPAARYEPARQLPAPLCPACGRFFAASEFPAAALLDHIGELESALDYWKGGQAARDLAEACRQLRAADRFIEQLRIAGLRVLTEIGADSSDDVRMLESLCKYNDDRKRAEFPLLDAIRAYLDAVDREGDVAAALARLRRAVEQTGG